MIYCPQPSVAHNIAQVVRRAIRTNPEVLARVANERASRHTISRRRAGYYPTIDVEYAYGKEKSLLATRASHITLNRVERRLTVSQMLFDGFATSYQVKSAEEVSLGNHYRSQQQRLVTALAAIENHINVLRFQRLYHLAANNKYTHQTLYNKVKVKFEKGAGNKADVELAESRLALARSILTSVDSDLYSAKASFTRTVGIYPKHLSSPRPTRRFIPPTLDKSIALGLRYHPSIHSTNLNTQASDLDIKDAYSRYYPRLTFELRASNNKNLDGILGPNKDLQGTFNLRFNIFRGGADRAQIYEARERSNSVHFEEDNNRRAVQEQIILAWYALRASRYRSFETASRVKAARGVVVAYRKQFTLGKRSLLNLLDTERELFNARNELVNANADLKRDTYRFYAAIGILLPVVLNDHRPLKHIRDVSHHEALHVYTRHDLPHA